MDKRLGLLIASIAAFAFAAPAAASAEPTLTMPPGTFVPKETKIVTTSSGLKIKTSFGTIECGSMALEWNVVINGGASFVGVGIGESNIATCKSVEGVQLTDFTPKQLLSTKVGKGGMGLIFGLDLPGLTCQVIGEPQFTYPLTEGSEIKVASQKLKVTPEACGSVELEANFTLETTTEGGGGPVTIGMPGSKLTDPPNVLVAKGSLLRLTSSNLFFRTSFGNILCGSTVINSELTMNSGSIVAGVGSGAGSTTGCSGAINPKVTDVTLKSFESNLKGEGVMNLTSQVDISTITCHVESPPGGVKYTYESASDKLSIAEQSLVVTPEACGSVRLAADFTLETINGGSVILD